MLFFISKTVCGLLRSFGILISSKSKGNFSAFKKLYASSRLVVYIICDLQSISKNNPASPSASTHYHKRLNFQDSLSLRTIAERLCECNLNNPHQKRLTTTKVCFVFNFKNTNGYPIRDDDQL